MAATTGRKQVAPGQVIQSAEWGNPLWDQSVQAFQSAADRATQYPTPHAGAITWREDKQRLEKWNGTAARWEHLPPPAYTGGGLFLQITPYVGQPVVRVTGNASVTTDGNAQILLLSSVSIGGGIIGLGLSGAATFCITAAFQNTGNNLYAKLFNVTAPANNLSIAVTWWADCYDP